MPTVSSNELTSKLFRVLLIVDAIVIVGVEIQCVRLYNMSLIGAVISGTISFIAIAALMTWCLRWITPKEKN